MIYTLNIRYRFRSVGKNVYISGKQTVLFRDVVLGNDVFVGDYCHFGVKGLFIDDHTLLAPQVAFVGGDHTFNIKGQRINESVLYNHTKRQYLEQKGIKIGKDCWLGFRSIIFDGVNIGEGAVIAAGSLINKDVEPYTVVAGVPARFIKHRFGTKQDALEHSKSINGDYWRNFES